jgi:carbon-monoxide dehydrogenase small subunit
MRIRLTVNGRLFERDVDPELRLLDLLREDLHLTGTKEGCGEGECGACTVLFNGRAVNSCLIPAPQADGAEILTIEGLADGRGLHPIQQAYVETGAVQCGFCTPGFIMSTYALLKDHPDPSEEEILSALEGNLCRCTGYGKILEAVKLAAARWRAVE